MTEVRFYHMTRTPLDQALPKMLERTLERGQRAVVRAGSEARVEALSARLWTYHDRSFLPHGTVKDGRAERQPVWLTVADDEAHNDDPNTAPNDPTTQPQVSHRTARERAQRVGARPTTAERVHAGEAAGAGGGRDGRRRQREDRR